VTLKNLNLTEQTCRADKQEGQQKQAINIRCGENCAHAKPNRSTLLGLIVHPLQRADPQALSFCSAMANEQMSAPRDLVVFD
jgi:hypothetical protein